MLQLEKITKVYKTDSYTQWALDGVSISFRKNEFASILGPSGSGKTTLLNIIGGLDKYDTGNLIINEISTKHYKEKDWNSYRNHRIGFVFQSYNLISHQTVLANVELALTLSGVSKKERRKKAKDALVKVGLAKHINKRPSQLSGGQMQRVAIARSLVNDPDILLADEPTGALDSETSVQIMNLIKEIAKEKLVIMVTHNAELAKEYSTRIIELKDGKVINDTNPYDGNEDTKDNEEVKNKKEKKTSMSMLTALSLSLNNLMTKKGRTILTAFAGSIGIIGIALILSLSSGVNNYINNVQKDAMLSYPITIEAESMDLSSLITSTNSFNDEDGTSHDNNAIYSNSLTMKRANLLTGSLTKNNLTEFKKYLDDPNSEINKYIGENGVVYKYGTEFSTFSYDADEKLINNDGSTFDTNTSKMMGQMTQMSKLSQTKIFTELMSDGTDTVSHTIKDNYELLYGSYPEKYNEIVLVLNSNNELSLTNLYYLGLLPSSEYKEILTKMGNDEKIEFETKQLSYEDVIGKKYYLVPNCDFYIKNKIGLYEDVSDTIGKVSEIVKNNSLELSIVGVIRLKDEKNVNLISGNIGYTRDLTEYIIDYTNKSDVVLAQEKNKDKNVINGLKFTVTSDKEKAVEAKNYMLKLSTSEKANLATILLGSTSQGAFMMNMSEEMLAAALTNYLQNPDQKALVAIYDEYISPGSYEENMKEFGKVEMDTPIEIDIYADTFEKKDGITDAIKKYNETAQEEDKITYTDYVGLLMSSVTNIVNVISYVLIAFVSISLIVSSIMIAIITYISVLERTKEIGILRAIGASKKDITRVFNAETFIEGFVAGLFGIIITLLLNIPINIIIKNISGIAGISSLPILGGLLLILISVLLTVIAGLIPSRMAAKKDPVIALRSE